MKMLHEPGQWGKRYHFDNIYQPMLELSMVQLYQAGEIIAGDAFEIVEHTQECSEISYIVSGKCEIHAGDQVFRAVEGDVHVIAPGQRHRIVAEQDTNFRMAYIGFSVRPEIAESQFGGFYENVGTAIQKDHGQLSGIFEQLLTEIYISQECGVKIVDACLTQILIYVWRIFCMTEKPPIRSVSDEVRMEYILGHTVFRALRYMDAHLAEIEKVRQISEKLRYNESYLSKVFREKTGMTMTEYIAGKKIENAKKLLAEGNSVGDTAQKLGYATAQSFGKMFRRYTGQSPTEYLRQTQV